jgi:hypothetical protein
MKIKVLELKKLIRESLEGWNPYSGVEPSEELASALERTEDAKRAYLAATTDFNKRFPREQHRKASSRAKKPIDTPERQTARAELDRLRQAYYDAKDASDALRNEEKAAFDAQLTPEDHAKLEKIRVAMYGGDPRERPWGLGS